jgi:hypothetical protein
MFDAMVADMQKTPAQREIEDKLAKKFTSVLDKDIQERIEYHTLKIEELQSKTNASAAIKYHESRLAYYMA